MSNNTELRKATERGIANHGWLQSRHSFSFGSYYDPEHVGFSDLLVINKVELAPYVGVNLEVMRADAERMRRGLPFVMANVGKGDGVDEIVAFLTRQGGLSLAAA